MSNDTLWRLAQEQSGATMTAEAFRGWRERHAYTLDTAARALGLRRMVAYYEKRASARSRALSPSPPRDSKQRSRADSAEAKAATHYARCSTYPAEGFRPPRTGPKRPGWRRRARSAG